MLAKDYRLSIIIAVVTIISIKSVIVVVVVVAVVVAIHFGIQSFFPYGRTRAVSVTPLLKMAFQCSRGNKFIGALGTSKFSINPANRDFFFFFFNEKVTSKIKVLLLPSSRFTVTKSQ